jgi:hypothetical protein
MKRHRIVPLLLARRETRLNCIRNAGTFEHHLFAVRPRRVLPLYSVELNPIGSNIGGSAWTSLTGRSMSFYSADFLWP